MYEKLFRPQALRIIGQLLKGEKTLTDLSVILEMSKPSLQQRYMNDLIDLEVVEKRIVKNGKGREVRYKLCPFSLVFSIDPDNGKCMFMVSTFRIDDGLFLLHQVRNQEFYQDLSLFLESINRLLPDERPNNIILYGSVAKGSGTEKSDIDIALLADEWTEPGKNRIIDIVSKVTFNTKHVISPIFLSEYEFLNGRESLIGEMMDTGLIIFSDKLWEGPIWDRMKRYGNISL